jgi:7-cyano-7-deazaguanine synthase
MKEEKKGYNKVMKKINKKAVVVHSGGMDSSICLCLAIEQFGADNVLAISFNYGQRHSNELLQAEIMCKHFKVDRIVLDINCLSEITQNSLTDLNQDIKIDEDGTPNTLVSGRNGLMARIAAIHANELGADCIFMGVIEVEEANSGYRDCSRKYMDIVQAALRMDFDNNAFEIKTPIVFMTKKQTMELGYQMGVLQYLLDNTITCYNGVIGVGCQKCPACKLRNDGLREFLATHEDFVFSFKDQL